MDSEIEITSRDREVAEKIIDECNGTFADVCARLVAEYRIEAEKPLRALLRKAVEHMEIMDRDHRWSDGAIRKELDDAANG